MKIHGFYPWIVIKEKGEDITQTKAKEEKNVLLKEKQNEKKLQNKVKAKNGITLIALVITILFSYNEKIKYSNSKGFFLTTI